MRFEKPIVNAVELIGDTPVFQLTDQVYVKLEKYNAGGSVKDRAVLGMLQQAQAEGLIKEDTVLVEATSGNTGIALAMMGAILNIRVIITMPESMSKERRELVKAYGAQLVLTPKETGMQGAVDKANELLKEIPNAMALRQFANPANPNKHYETTAEEILKQVPDVAFWVAGVGTGGTFTGVAKRLKEANADIKAIAVEPATSQVLKTGVAGPHKIQGIGANFVPANFERALADGIEAVTDDEAMGEVQAFMRKTGLSIGISSGAAIVAAKRIAAANPGKKVVTVAPDGVEKYLSMLTFEDVNYL